MKLDMLETCQLGGVTQRIRIRTADTDNPVLLLMQQGPGLPIINEVRRFERLLRLEDAFTVVYWDQRGTGLSALPLRKRSKEFEISPRHMIDDTVELLELLRDRFGGKTFVAGFSFGATYAAQAAVRRPDLVAALVATGMDIDIPVAEAHTYDFALTTARQRGSRRAVRQLEAIGPPPHLEVRKFTTRARWAANFGGVQRGASFMTVGRDLMTSLVRSRDYSVTDIIRTVRGISTSQAALLPQLADTDLVATMPKLEVPIVIAQGRLDQVAPGAAAQRFHDLLAAPSKELVWFENSAHTPQLDEPGKFRSLLMDVKARHLAEA
jgi:pimeloyl-ACP methyl ester carboxylesterase